jgi:predicted transcriptional regulator
MNLPQEIEVWYIIPAIRRELAKAMLKKGLKQKDVADRLGVTDAAISQYLKSKRASEVRFDSAMREEIEKSAERIMKGGNAMKEVQCIVRLCRMKGLVCRTGKKLGNSPRGCRACFSEVCFHG